MSGLSNSKRNTNYVKKLYGGITQLKPVLINPSVEELREKGVDTDKVRQYTNLELKDKIFTKIVIFFNGVGLTGENFLTSGEFLISNRVRTSTSGKIQFKSKAGVFSWGVTAEDLPEWFIKKGEYRPAFEGEENLLNFFIALGNLDTYSEGAEVGFADWDALVRGDVSELKDYIFGGVEAFMNQDALGNNLDVRNVNALLHISNEKYMRVFERAFDTQESLSCKNIMKALDGLTTKLEGVNMNNPQLEEFKPSLVRNSTTEVETEKPSDLPF
jgi:hypothetical protein